MNWFKQEMTKLNLKTTELDIMGYKVNDLVVLHIDGLTMLSEYLS